MQQRSLFTSIEFLRTILSLNFLHIEEMCIGTPLVLLPFSQSAGMCFLNSGWDSKILNCAHAKRWVKSICTSVSIDFVIIKQPSESRIPLLDKSSTAVTSIWVQVSTLISSGTSACFMGVFAAIHSCSIKCRITPPPTEFGKFWNSSTTLLMRTAFLPSRKCIVLSTPPTATVARTGVLQFPLSIMLNFLLTIAYLALCTWCNFSRRLFRCTSSWISLFWSCCVTVAIRPTLEFGSVVPARLGI